MINFKVVRWKNFIATGNAFTEVRLDKDKMTLFVGANGSGKSQLLDAVTFALFNKPFRKINKPSVINSINGKECVVEIEFETNGSQYKVIRGLKPAVFEIWQNDVMIDQEAATRDYQEFLEKSILQTSFKSFTQIVILGSATFTPFMRLSAADRREVLDDLLGVQVFSSMSVLAKQRMSDLKQSITVNDLSIANARDKIEYLQKQIDNLKINSNSNEKRIADEITALERDKVAAMSKIEKIEAAIEHYKNLIIGESTISSQISELIMLHTKIQTKLRSLNDQTNFYNNNQHCNSCNQPIDEKFRLKVIEDNKVETEKLTAGIDMLTEKLNDVRKKSQEIEENKNLLRKCESEQSVLASKLKDTTLMISKRQAEMRLASSDGNTLLLQQNIQELAQTEADLENFINLKQDYADAKEVLEIGLQVLKDGGIKTQIVKQYLPVINQTVNRYLNSMDFMVNFVLDENFDETIMARYKDEFSYANFSEGEKARIDLSLLLTWRHIAKKRNSVNTNLLILDEVFDGSLDAAGSEELVSIFKNVVTDCNVFVISHRENMRDQFDKTIHVKKINNFSVQEM